VIVFLDTNIVIYSVERNLVWGPKVAVRLAALKGAGDEAAISDLIRMECRVGPLKSGNMVRLNEFDAFFASPEVQVFPATAAVCDRASEIRAAHGFKPLDALHLAAAIENHCGLFLTNDTRLSRFAGIPIEVLT
jgi:predicted nucleic acid-binding protein